MSFYRKDYFWVEQLKSNWLAIRSEYDAIAHNTTMWPEEQLHNNKWKVFGLTFFNKEVLSNKQHAPITSKICDNIPGITTYGFSIMQPGCEILPHKGYTDKVLRCHLGLYTNILSGIQVGDTVSNWDLGEVLIFDDTQLHSAWNRGYTDRVILLLDFLKA